MRVEPSRINWFRKLQILAISDIVIYRTRSERLHSDMYDFLGTASKAFCLHFSQALQTLAMQGSANLGPTVIVFHETRHTKPLENCKLQKSVTTYFKSLTVSLLSQLLQKARKKS